MRVASWECPICRKKIDGGDRGLLLPVRHNCLTLVACIHRGEIIERIVCRGCGGSREVDVYACDIHGRCHTVPANDHRAGMSCTACAMADEGFQSREKISPES